MSNYTNKERDIIRQCNEGPFHTLIIKITIEEFNELVTKLIVDDEAYTLTSLVAIYSDYNRNKIIDYFVDKGDVELLLGFLDYCNDFSTQTNQLDQKYVVDKLLNKNDKKLIKDILNNNSIYFLTDINEKEKLIKCVS
ncbi:MAG: hypothetical protein IJO33_00470 [Bacilli bacterium]|nr:hypothetical protein [Bacilli bacterium]